MSKAYLILVDSPNQVSTHIQSIFVGEKAQETARQVLKDLVERTNAADNAVKARVPVGQIDCVQLYTEDEKGLRTYVAFYNIMAKDITEC